MPVMTISLPPAVVGASADEVLAVVGRCSSVCWVWSTGGGAAVCACATPGASKRSSNRWRANGTTHSCRSRHAATLPSLADASSRRMLSPVPMLLCERSLCQARNASRARNSGPCGHRQLPNYGFPSAAAARARWATSARSVSPGLMSQLPPTHSTASSASQSGAVSAVIPPVGQKRRSPNGPDSAFSAANPARAFGREEFEPVEAEVEPAHDVAGGRHARQERHSRVAAPRSASGLVRPGETMKLGAGVERLGELGLVEHRAGADDRARHLDIARIASSATGVRKVTSSTGRPACDQRRGELGRIDRRRRAPAPGSPARCA